MNPDRLEPLTNHPKYQKVRSATVPARRVRTPSCMHTTTGPQPQQRHIWFCGPSTGQDNWQASGHQIHWCVNSSSTILRCTSVPTERGEKVTKYVQREILNHRLLVHAHVVQLREVHWCSPCCRPTDDNHIEQLTTHHHSGVFDTAVLGHRHGICSRRGHV